MRLSRKSIALFPFECKTGKQGAQKAVRYPLKRLPAFALKCETSYSRDFSRWLFPFAGSFLSLLRSFGKLVFLSIADKKSKMSRLYLNVAYVAKVYNLETNMLHNGNDIWRSCVRYSNIGWHATWKKGQQPKWLLACELALLEWNICVVKLGFGCTWRAVYGHVRNLSSFCGWWCYLLTICST